LASALSSATGDRQASAVEGLVITAALPVFVVARDSGEVMKFDSVYDMQHRLERIDIENSEYVARESHGRPLRLSVQKPVWLKIGLASAQSADKDLRSALLRWAHGLGLDTSRLSDLSLSALFDQIASRARTWRVQTVASSWQPATRSPLGRTPRG